MNAEKLLQIKKFKKYNLIKLIEGMKEMEYTIEDLQRIVNAKSTCRVRNILCRAEFEKKRIPNSGYGKKLVYQFNALDLQAFKDAFNPNKKQKDRKE